MIRLIVSFDTSAPYTSAKWAAISPVVRPFAASEITSSSTPASRRCRLATIFGSNEPSRSRGTSICTSPTSVNSVFERLPLRELPLSRPSGGMLRIAEMVVHLDLQRRLQNGLRQARQQTAGADKLHTFGASPLDQLLRQTPLGRRLSPNPDDEVTSDTTASHPPPSGQQSGHCSYTVSRTVPGPRNARFGPPILDFTTIEGPRSPWFVVIVEGALPGRSSSRSDVQRLGPEPGELRRVLNGSETVGR